MSANEKQVGGAHYTGSYQHWDWAGDVRLDYLLGCATKYVTRWRQKNGLEDLQKAMHYLQKRQESGFAKVLSLRKQNIRAYTERFAVANKLSPLEFKVLLYMATHEFKEAAEMLGALMETATARSS